MSSKIGPDLSSMIEDGFDYWRDAVQRSILFADILRKRGNIYLEHLRSGQPPVLTFDHETILDARTFERPANYALVRIIDRRSGKPVDRRRKAADLKNIPTDRRLPHRDRRHPDPMAHQAPNAVSRPIVIVDPRAGHGPGIGGSKQDSQIGMALNAGHPVYFISFFTDPMPGQTLADVRNAQIRFVEDVRKRHPNAPKPAIIGNCQGGWAAALIGAERPDLVGPMVFNGSPLSYWGGVEGANPMRYLGGLWGGVWINSFLSDLGHGKFDGANLVGNFENLNPANTLWTKQYNLYTKVDTEEKRYLDFEKWWGGFFLMNAEEIHTIVDGLFVGNKLERGEFELEKGKKVDLKDNHNPVIVFASFGDNITPPQQAFNWIIKAYGTVEEIKRRGQVIVCIEHEKVGHLGIFVSAGIARKEHKEIIASFDMLNYLPPGLYGMEIEEDPETQDRYLVRYVEKQMDDILALDDGLADEEAFYPVRAMSRINDTFYRLFVSPWVKLAVNEPTAETLRQLHPLRIQRKLFSDQNPWMMPVSMWAAMIKSGNTRQPAAQDNVYRQMEKQVSQTVISGLDAYRDTRDRLCEQVFKSIYENPWMTVFQPFTSPDKTKADQEKLETLRRRDADHWRKAMVEGKFPDAVIRILLAVGFADQEIYRRGYASMGRLIRENRRFKDIDDKKLQQIVRNQARSLQTDADRAIDTLPRLLPGKKDRRDALSFLKKVIKTSGRQPKTEEQVVLDRITAALKG